MGTKHIIVGIHLDAQNNLNASVELKRQLKFQNVLNKKTIAKTVVQESVPILEKKALINVEETLGNVKAQGNVKTALSNDTKLPLTSTTAKVPLAPVNAK